MAVPHHPHQPWSAFTEENWADLSDMTWEGPVVNKDIVYDSVLELSEERNIVYDSVLELSKERNIVYFLQSLVFAYHLKIYNTGGTKVAEITGDFENVTLTELGFELLQQGGCGAFSFTLAEPFTIATIDYDYRVEIYIFSPQVLYYTGKIINKPKKGTEKPQTYSGWGYGYELEKKIIDTEISPGSDIAVAVTNVLDTFITPYTGILKDATLIETVSHDLVATIDFEDEYAKEIFNRLRELAVDYKSGVNKNRKFYFQAIDASINYYWHIGKHLTEFLPEEDLSDLVKKVIAVYPEVFSDGYRLKITSQSAGYAGLYDKRFSLPEIVSPFSTTDLASGITPTTNPEGSGAANLCDGDYSTLWASGINQASGHYIEIDLGEDKENIASVVIDSIHTNAQEYNAKSVKIEIKPDGGSYATMLSSDDNIGWKPTITFRPTTGRYVKLSLTGSSSEEWKVGGVGIYQLDLTDAQRWADWKLTTLENVKKRATAKFDGVDRYIMKQSTLTAIKPSGKARIFDEDGTKIDDYQVKACHYSLSTKGFNLNRVELGEEERTIADEMKDMERRIRENENSGVRRAKNLSLSKGFQLSQIKGTYIGEHEIQSKHVAAKSLLAEMLSITDLADIKNLLTIADYIKIGATVLPGNKPGIAITDGVRNRFEAGQINSDFGVNLRDVDGVLFAQLGKLQQIWVKVYDEYITGVAKTEIAITGLDGDNDQIYYIIWKVQCNGVDSAFSLEFNDDNANSYGRTYSGTDGVNPIVGTIDPTNRWVLMVAQADNQYSQCYLVVDARKGFTRLGNIYSCERISGTTVRRTWSFGQVWNNTASNIIKMRFYADRAGAIEIGSHLSIYKIPGYA